MDDNSTTMATVDFEMILVFNLLVTLPYDPCGKYMQRASEFRRAAHNLLHLVGYSPPFSPNVPLSSCIISPGCGKYLLRCGKWMFYALPPEMDWVSVV